MNKSWLRIRKSLMLLAMGASTFGVLVPFGTEGLGGCTYAFNSDYKTMFEAIGSEVIDAMYETYFQPLGEDYDRFIGQPSLQFTKSAWSHWVDLQIPDDPVVR